MAPFTIGAVCTRCREEVPFCEDGLCGKWLVNLSKSESNIGVVALVSPNVLVHSCIILLGLNSVSYILDRVYIGRTCVLIWSVFRLKRSISFCAIFQHLDVTLIGCRLVAAKS